jgi:hypothetical protein
MEFKMVIFVFAPFTKRCEFNADEFGDRPSGNAEVFVPKPPAGIVGYIGVIFELVFGFHGRKVSTDFF